MKRYFKLLGAVFFSLAIFSSCNKDTVEITDTTVGHSRITNFPILTVKGPAYVAVAMGSTFTEPGVAATEGGNTIPVITAGAVNTAVPGVYQLAYSAVNKDGFSSTGSRYVVVYSTAADAVANDFSGTYLRAATGAVAVWTKLAPGVYTVLNPGGAVNNTLVAVVFNQAGLTIKIPSQRTTDGNITSSTDEKYRNTSPVGYEWKIVNPGFGTALRTFVKQ